MILIFKRFGKAFFNSILSMKFICKLSSDILLKAGIAAWHNTTV